MLLLPAPWKTSDFEHPTGRIEFQLESLESREMMAGNVRAVLTGGGDLRVTGDGQNNVVQISTVIPGFVTISGDNGTTINGDAFVNISLAEFAGSLADDVIVNLRGGDDRVIVGELGFTTSIGDQLVITGGGGDDNVGLYQVLADDVKVFAGGGNDLVGITNSSIVSTMTVSGAGGNDAVYFECSFVSDFARINTGSGEDGVFFASSANRVDIRTGGGNDLITLGNTLLGVADGRFYLGGGDDVIAASDTATYTLNPVVGGGGFDTVLLSFATGFQDAQLNTEANIITNDANTTTIVAAIAFQAEWVNRGGSGLLFTC